MAANAAKRQSPKELLLHWAFPAIDDETGKAMEYRQLKNHPRLGPTWNTSYSNEMGRLCQDVGGGDKGPKKQRVEGTDTFRVIKFKDIPVQRRKGIAHVRVECEVRPQKRIPTGRGSQAPGATSTTLAT